MLRQQTDLREQIEKGPRKVKRAEVNESRFADDVKNVKESLQRTRMLADERQLQLGTREAKIEDMKGKRNACDSNREYQLLNERIAADEQANSVQSDEILELLERIDQLEVEHKEAIANLEKASSETEGVRNVVAQEQGVLSAELERVSGELADAEKRMPGELMVDYRRLVAANGENALSETDRETCGNCYRQLTRQIVDQLLLQEPLFCQGCGSLMYVAQESAAGY